MTATLRDEDVLPLRMASLLLAHREERTPEEIVTWFGAMQAQDLASGHWSFGARIPGSTVGDIERATQERRIMRTWPMRGTVHFVPPRDARWMLRTTGVNALAGSAKRREYLGLTEEIVHRAVDVLAAALQGGKRLTRAECVGLLIEAGVHTASQHGYHLLWYASQIGVTTIGPNEGKEQTFVLLDEWVPDPVEIDRDEALATLALRYFRSHGPTTVKDFAGWAGLKLSDSRAGVAGAGDALATVDVDGTPHVMGSDLLDQVASKEHQPADRAGEVLLLPGFDEFMLGYKDRSRMLDDRYKDLLIPGGNGVFKPTIVRDGRVLGTWRRTLKKTRVDLVPLPFEPLGAADLAGFEAAGKDYARYLGLEPVFA